MEVVHIELNKVEGYLSNKGGDVAVFKACGENLFCKKVRIKDAERSSISAPGDDRVCFRV